MTLEISADSKADAERKATQQGMNVLNVQEVAGSDPSIFNVSRKARPRESSNLAKIGAMILLGIIIVYFAGSKLLHLIHH